SERKKLNQARETQKEGKADEKPFATSNTTGGSASRHPPEKTSHGEPWKLRLDHRRGTSEDLSKRFPGPLSAEPQRHARIWCR
ncbi:unnamed protein product, partial [Chrysoparadoxa australica]